MIVSTALTTNEFEAGGGVGAPVEGISPAIAVAESAKASAVANISRFIFFSFVIEYARTLAIIPDSFENKLVAKPKPGWLISGARKSKVSDLHPKRSMSLENSLTKTSNFSPFG